MPRPRQLARFVLPVALVLTAIETAQGIAAARMRGGPVPPWPLALLGNLAFWAAVLVIFPAIVWLTDRVPFTTRGWRTSAALQFGASLIFPFVQIGVWTLLLYPLQPAAVRITWLDAMQRAWGSAYFTDLLLYWVIVGALEMVRLGVRSAQLDATLAESRLHALRSQLHPHFLFNTLNAITVLAEQRDTTRVALTTRQLATLLRTSLDRTQQMIALGEELEFTRQYLDIEQTRCGSRLVVAWHIEARHDVLVPSFVLQPLVENAIKHAVSHSADAVRVEIGATVDNDALRLWVVDDGPPLSLATPLVHGLGLSNLRARLEHLYGTDAVLSTTVLRRGVRAEAVIPNMSVAAGVA